MTTSTSGWSPGVKMRWLDAGRGADLGREIRQRGDVVARDGRLVGELGPGQLHPVAGIACETDDDGLQLFDRLGSWGLDDGRGRAHSL
jgi:hypothetical protein